MNFFYNLSNLKVFSEQINKMNEKFSEKMRMFFLTIKKKQKTKEKQWNNRIM